MNARTGARAPRSISLAKPFVADGAAELVASCLSAPQLSRGSVTKDFESHFAFLHGHPLTLAMSSGTSALHTAIWATDMNASCNVICPALTYAGTLNAITANGSYALLCDVDPVTWGLSRTTVMEALNRASYVTGIVQVHLYGVADDIGSFFVNKKKIPLVEDAAEALFAVAPSGARAGNMGDAAIFSFFGNKIVATGEGGMLVTRKPEVFERAKRFAGQGQHEKQRYFHVHHGMNYRITELASAVGLATLRVIDSVLEARRALWARYEENAASAGYTARPKPKGASISPWLFPAMFPSEQARMDAEERLGAAGVETRRMFTPLHVMPTYSVSYIFRPGGGHWSLGRDFPVAEDIFRRCLVLPLHNGMTTDDVDYIGEVIRG